MAIRVGCGSWGDPEYVGVLYPPGTPPELRLQSYARHFDYVEVNSSYYACPRVATVQNWIRQTPDDFIFDLKLHRNILSSLAKVPKAASRRKTSPAKVPSRISAKPATDLLTFLLGQVRPLIRAKKLGAFLLLLPPRFAPEKNGLEELDELVKRLRPHRLAVEFRNRAWVDGKNRATTLGYFRKNGIAWVSVDMPPLDDPTLMPAMNEVTQPALAYLRLHGRNRDYLKAESAAERHDYLYPKRELKEIVARIEKLASQATEVRVVANNHCRDFAPRTALALKELLHLE